QTIPGVREKGGFYQMNTSAGQNEHGKEPKNGQKDAGLLLEDEIDEHQWNGGIGSKNRDVRKNVHPANQRLLGPRSTALPARRKSGRVEQLREKREHVDLRNRCRRTGDEADRSVRARVACQHITCRSAYHFAG